ncbi:IS66 family insertion sequence element accessory protein TnpA [Bacteroides acidifaciens]|uniref:IS66 family insertion sequence element accessory protein TnpA n=1 Tax=Bacteroides acidifaciens TaxID=85831 RepID=UPI0026290F78|nr:hypothetical protein [Bacteroides acidifaciens]
MDKVTYVRKRLNREQWKAIIKECRSSGMTTTAWCKANGICEQTYYKHLKKLREEMIESFPSSITSAETDNKPAVFRRLEVQSPVPETKAAVIIRLGNAVVEINNGASRDTVEAVLLALKSL